jgi:hypothetical protein
MAPLIAELCDTRHDDWPAVASANGGFLTGVAA